MKAKTIASYQDLLRRINEEIGPSKPGQNKITGQPLSPKTIREHHWVISSILALAVKEGLVPFNAAQRATPPKAPKHEMDVFEVEELQNILEALKTEPMKWRVVTNLLIATGPDGARSWGCAGRTWITKTGGCMAY